MRPLFLGYLFVAFDITTDGWRKINFRHVIEPNRYVRKPAKIKVSAP
jgi:transcription antitermination factor NusG